MANQPLHHVLRFLRGVARAAADDADACLLERFARRRDEEAFAALVRRHGPTVFGVCRRVLGDEHLAEDAFQATFLVLARKAGSVRRGVALAGWLGRVAFHVALRAKKQASRHPAGTGPVEDLPQEGPAGPGPEVRALLDEEVSRLPEKYRAPVVLCYWQGKTYEEAAAQLGWPGGTVAGRLARARGLLRRRLIRRGVAPAAAAGLVACDAAAAVPAPLLGTTVRAAARVAGGAPAGVASARAVALMEGVVRSAFRTRAKLVAAVLLAVVAAGVAVGVALRRQPADPPAPQQEADEADERPEPLMIGRKGTAPPGEVEARATFRHGGQVFTVLFSPDGASVLTAGRDSEPGPVSVEAPFYGRVKSWHLADGKEGAGPLELRDLVQGAALGPPDGKYLAVCTSGYGYGTPDGITGRPGELMVFDRLTGRPAADLGGGAFAYHCVAFSPDGKTLAAGGSAFDVRGRPLAPGGVVRLWDVATGREVAALKGHEGHVAAVAFSPDGKTLASAGIEVAPRRNQRTRGGLRLWDLATGKEKAAPGGHGGLAVWSVAFSPDGALLASGGGDGVVRLWDAATGEEVAALRGHRGAVAAVAFAPDGRTLASAGGEPGRDRAPGELKLWDVAERREKATLKGHEVAIGALAFDREGRRLASGDFDGVAKVWDVGHLTGP